ncbi:hypothetical protein MMC07_009737, partial [Pseudocyphellaria aurata]|nr:hypothetical protein [Pseudocyphellaria aurata]
GENTECMILVVTDAYGMGIDNPDIALVIQWDLPLSFDTMIQRMGRTGHKGGASTFVLFSPKWTKVKDLQEIEDRVTSRIRRSSTGVAFSTSLSASNRPTTGVSPLSQMVSAKDNDSDAGSVAGSDFDEEYNVRDEDFVSNVFSTTEADKKHAEHKNWNKKSSTDATKRAKMPDEIFDYIHVARCQRLFPLAWYNDLTYAVDAAVPEAAKALPDACCNGLSCQSPKPACLQREPFIKKLTKPRLSESDREWIAYRTAELT